MKIKNPKLTLNVVDIVDSGYGLVLDDNNELVDFEIDSNGTYETVAYRIYFADFDNSGTYKFIGADFDGSAVEISDAVNCTLERGAFIIITDPTKDASCTVNEIAG